MWNNISEIKLTQKIYKEHTFLFYIEELTTQKLEYLIWNKNKNKTKQKTPYLSLNIKSICIVLIGFQLFL